MENKEKIVIFSAGDINNFPYAVMFWNSLVKFHDPNDIDMIFYTNETDENKLKLLPKAVQVEQLGTFLQDPMFWYRQKPLLAEPLLEKYDLAIGMDCDQIVVGKLDYIFETKDYDVGTVLNWNRYDINYYPQVDIQQAGIYPVEYFNCGLVALRNKKFVHEWKVNCFSTQFDRLQYKEQDILNIMCYFGNYNVRCFDHGDGVANMHAWWGLISKGEYLRAKFIDNEIIIEKGLGDTPFPPQDMTLKVLHAGGGTVPDKMNYRKWFKDEKIISFFDYLVSNNSDTVEQKTPLKKKQEKKMTEQDIKQIYDNMEQKNL